MSNENPKDLFIYSANQAVEICNIISENPMSLKKICEIFPKLPKPEIIYGWLRQHPDFREMYYLAKVQQVEPLIDRMMEVAQDAKYDYFVDGSKISFNSENVIRARLEIDTIKWIATRLVPALYGNKVQAEITTNDPNGLITAKEIAKKCKLAFKK